MSLMSSDFDSNCVAVDVTREISCSFSTSEKSSPLTDCSSLPLKTTVSSEAQTLEKSYVFYKKKYKRSSLIIRKTLKEQVNILTIILLVTNIFSIVFFSLLFAPKCDTSRYPLSVHDINKGKTTLRLVNALALLKKLSDLP
jgi:hypothetical protein